MEKKLNPVSAIVCIFAIVIAISACSSQSASGGSKEPLELLKGTQLRQDNSVFVDDETGCEYILLDGSQWGAIQPRLDSDGKSIKGCKGVAK